MALLAFAIIGAFAAGAGIFGVVGWWAGRKRLFVVLFEKVGRN